MNEFPRSGSILGISNVSFGLAPAARAALSAHEVKGLAL